LSDTGPFVADREPIVGRVARDDAGHKAAVQQVNAVRG
jgi:hypothetical protein